MNHQTVIIHHFEFNVFHWYGLLWGGSYEPTNCTCLATDLGQIDLQVLAPERNIVHKAVAFSQVVADKNTVGSAASASYFSPSTNLTSAHSVGMACHLAVADQLTLAIGEGWADSGSE